MPELARTRTASRSAFLDLRDEQRLVNDGYEFLDEKRILLAESELTRLSNEQIIRHVRRRKADA